MRVNYKGFTVIELMITMTILSALLLTGSFSYSILAERWQQQLGDFESRVAEFKTLNALQNTLDGISPRLIFSSLDSSVRVPSVFFVGKKESMLAISNTGFFSDNKDEVFRLATERTDEGTYNLVYQSVNVSQSPVYLETQAFTFTNKKVLFENVDEFEFQYLGWNDIESRSEGIEKMIAPTWRASYSGLVHQLLPEKVKLTISIKEKQIVIYFYPNKESLRVITPYLNTDGDNEI